MKVEIEKLNIYHSTLDFDCGDDEVNSFFERSFEEVELKNSQVYVITGEDQIIGFYAISMASIRAEINGMTFRHPVSLIGQLGVNKPFQGQGYGSYILDIAVKKAKNVSKEIGCKGLIIETYKDDLVDSLYKKKGFYLLDKRDMKGKGQKYILFFKFQSD